MAVTEPEFERADERTREEREAGHAPVRPLRPAKAPGGRAIEHRYRTDVSRGACGRTGRRPARRSRGNRGQPIGVGSALAAARRRIYTFPPFFGASSGPEVGWPRKWARPAANPARPPRPPQHRENGRKGGTAAADGGGFDTRAVVREREFNLKSRVRDTIDTLIYSGDGAAMINIKHRPIPPIVA